jgi:hypothetical protein
MTRIRMPPSVGIETRVDGWLLDPGAEFTSINDAPERIQELIRRQGQVDREPDRVWSAEVVRAVGSADSAFDGYQRMRARRAMHEREQRLRAMQEIDDV